MVFINLCVIVLLVKVASALYGLMMCQPVLLNPLTLKTAKFENILLTKAFSGKQMKEKCLSEAKLQLSFKYFVNFCFVLKVFSKV